MKRARTTFLFLLLMSIGLAQGHRFDTTFVNNKSTFRIETTPIDEDKLLLTSTSGARISIVDTIWSNGLAYIAYPDFDGDGNADLLVDYYGNNSTYFLYLFNAATNSFVEIEGYSRFPDAIQIKTDRRFYYSYHRAGCADMNWVSDLFTIQDHRLVHLGHIYGKGCDFEVEADPQVISIYKVQGNTEEMRMLVEKLPYRDHISESRSKWEFIERYWSLNLAKFK